MNSRICINFLLLLIPMAVYAQREINPSGWSLNDRAYMGFGLSGLNFGQDAFAGRFFSIGVSGQLGYMLTRHLSAGGGLEYNYTTYQDARIKHHVYNFYPFIRHNIGNFFVQFEYNWVTIKITDPTSEAKGNFERLFGGLGYTSPAGRNGYFNMLFSYDFLYTNNSPFASPLSIRFFFTGWPAR
ncbi:MAG: hypothetical protein N2044_08120 [Cyclobacteriaceae bacterium]|nr:hypothetical protein [Cyclobacteriaceae bacterium]MCX7637793.1 hypothetical protein [Cyclobacteriaceae bacterium]MDW8331034.1 hypothetical protein [Cyclobacteriaceae bacterium]